MTVLTKFLAICTACDGWVASACADDEEEMADALAMTRQWQARGDVPVMVMYDPAEVRKNPIALCSCQRPRAHIKKPESLVKWNPVDYGLPDADQTVLIAYQDAGDDLVFMGYHDGDGWVDVSGMPVAGVTHWADLPDPPAF